MGAVPHTTHCGTQQASHLCVVRIGLDAQSILQKFGKGKPIPAIIEAVSGGANLKATLLPDQYFVNINLVGVSCPSMNRRSQGAAPPPAAPAANGEAPAAAAEAAEGKNNTAGVSSAQCIAVIGSICCIWLDLHAHETECPSECKHALTMLMFAVIDMNAIMLSYIIYDVNANMTASMSMVGAYLHSQGCSVICTCTQTVSHMQ